MVTLPREEPREKEMALTSHSLFKTLEGAHVNRSLMHLTLERGTASLVVAMVSWNAGLMRIVTIFLIVTFVDNHHH